LAAVWAKIRRVQQVGLLDNFFEMGGDSLMAMRLLFAIEKEFLIKIPFAMISKASTIKQRAEILRNEKLIEHASVLIAVQTNGNKKPLYCIGGKGGLPIRFNNLLKYMNDDQPMYFFRSLGFEPGELVHHTIEEIAADYLHALRRIQPSGPYCLLGESGGGLVAYEMAQQLRSQNEEVAFLGVLDTYIPDRHVSSKKTILKEQIILLRILRKHMQTLASGGFEGLHVYIAYYLELWKFKRYQREDASNTFWRHAQCVQSRG
jgi:acyl carrier protein